jgi:hypothetical protein
MREKNKTRTFNIAVSDQEYKAITDAFSSTDAKPSVLAREILLSEAARILIENVRGGSDDQKQTAA